MNATLAYRPSNSMVARESRRTSDGAWVKHGRDAQEVGFYREQAKQRFVVSPDIDLAVEVNAAKQSERDSALKVLGALSETFAEMLRLKKDWDGYGANPIIRDAFKPATELYMLGYQKCNLPKVLPSVDGGIDLVWERENQVIDATVFDYSKCSVYVCQGDDETEEDMPLAKLKSYLLQNLVTN